MGNRITLRQPLFPSKKATKTLMPLLLIVAVVAGLYARHQHQQTKTTVKSPPTFGVLNPQAYAASTTTPSTDPNAGSDDQVNPSQLVALPSGGTISADLLSGKDTPGSNSGGGGGVTGAGAGPGAAGPGFSGGLSLPTGGAQQLNTANAGSILTPEQMGNTAPGVGGGLTLTPGGTNPNGGLISGPAPKILIPPPGVK